MTGIDLSQVKRILVIMMGGIGDMIFMTPALKALKKELPFSTISFLLGSYNAEKVIEGNPLVHQKFIIDSEKYKGMSGKIRLIRELRKENFSLSISATGTNPLKSGLLCYLSGIKHRLGENVRGMDFLYNLKIPFDDTIHEIESNINLVQRLGIKVQDKSLYIHRSPEDKDFARKFFSDLKLDGRLVIGMHPGSGIHQAKFRRWPKERFARLADYLINDYQASVIIFGGQEEAGLANEIKSLMKLSPLLMAGKTTLGQAAALIERCSLFVSNDSGLMHVACAVKTPTVGIFGPTDYRKTGPWSDSAIVVRNELDCSPCYRREKVKCTKLDCFESIAVEEVLKAIERLLKANL